MACLDMYNSDHKGKFCPPISPRISFSNDFVDSQHIIKQERSSSSSRSEADPVVSTDFEFSVTNYSMMTADELFSKGRLLPFKNNNNTTNNNNANGIFINNNIQMQRTIRDELLAGDEDDENEANDYDGISFMPPRGSSTSWKGLLGLKKAHIGSKKLYKGTNHEGSFGPDQMHVGKNSQGDADGEDFSSSIFRS